MKLGRACAVGAVLWAVALPLTAGIALADETPAPAPVATTPPATDEAAPPSAVPEEPTAAPAPGEQVSVVPEGAPETGGGPAEDGLDLTMAGAASAAALAAGGVVLAVRRRRAGAR